MIPMQILAQAASMAWQGVRKGTQRNGVHHQAWSGQGGSKRRTTNPFHEFATLSFRNSPTHLVSSGLTWYVYDRDHCADIAMKEPTMKRDWGKRAFVQDIQSSLVLLYKWRWYNSTELYTIVVGTIVQRDIQSACNAILYAAGGCTLHKNNFTLISAPGVQVADPPSFQIALPSWILSYLGTRIWIWMCL